MKIKYDMSLMKYISIFETLTKASVKDCIQEHNSIIFIVAENEIAKAIGRNGINVRKIEGAINKKVKIVEFSDNLLQFIRNLIMPIKPRDIMQQEGIVTIAGSDSSSKSLLIGRNGSNLRFYERIVSRYFKDVAEIKVI